MSYKYKKKEMASTPHSINIITLGLPKLFVAFKPMSRPVIPVRTFREEERQSVSTDTSGLQEKKKTNT